MVCVHDFFPASRSVRPPARPVSERSTPRSRRRTWRCTLGAGWEVRTVSSSRVACLTVYSRHNARNARACRLPGAPTSSVHNRTSRRCRARCACRTPFVLCLLSASRPGRWAFIQPADIAFRRRSGELPIRLAYDCFYRGLMRPTPIVTHRRLVSRSVRNGARSSCRFSLQVPLRCPLHT